MVAFVGAGGKMGRMMITRLKSKGGHGGEVVLIEVIYAMGLKSEYWSIVWIVIWMIFHFIVSIIWQKQERCWRGSEYSEKILNGWFVFCGKFRRL